MEAVAKQVEAQQDEKVTTAGLIDALAEIGGIDDEIDELKDRIDTWRMIRNKRTEHTIAVYNELELTEPFKHENYTVRVSKGRETVRVNDVQAWRLVGLIDKSVQDLTLEERWCFKDSKLFLHLWREKKLHPDTEVAAWEAANKREYFTDQGIIIRKPAEDKVIVERKKA